MDPYSCKSSTRRCDVTSLHNLKTNNQLASHLDAIWKKTFVRRRNKSSTWFIQHTGLTATTPSRKAIRSTCNTLPEEAKINCGHKKRGCAWRSQKPTRTDTRQQNNWPYSTDICGLPKCLAIVTCLKEYEKIKLSWTVWTIWKILVWLRCQCEMSQVKFKFNVFSCCCVFVVYC